MSDKKEDMGNIDMQKKARRSPPKEDLFGRDSSRRDTRKKMDKRQQPAFGQNKEKYSLPFILLSDPEHEVMESYGVWQEKKLYGKVSMGTVRTTYIIDENGVVEKVFTKVKAAQNPQDMLNELS